MLFEQFTYPLNLGLIIPTLIDCGMPPFTIFLLNGPVALMGYFLLRRLVKGPTFINLRSLPNPIASFSHGLLPPKIHSNQTELRTYTPFLD